jgi:hypothetical protein
MRQHSPSRWRPTIALLLPPLAWFLFQQGLSGLMRVRCGAGGPPLGPLWGGAGLLLCIVALWLAWPAGTRPIRADRPVSTFIARMAMLGAGVFALAILFQTLATLIVPPCVR